MHLSVALKFGGSFAVLSSLITPSLAISAPATKDSTILRSTVSCPDCLDRNCYKCTLGHEDTLRANTGGLAYVRSLIGFKIPVPAASVAGCSVQFPAFTKPLQFPVNVTIAQATSSDWDESTVCGDSAPDSGEVFINVPVPASTNMLLMDISNVCKSVGEDGEFSIYLGTEFDSIEIWSKESGNPAILHVATKKKRERRMIGR